MSFLRHLIVCVSSITWISAIEDVKRALETSVSEISCIYLFTIGKVHELRDVMKIDDRFDDDSYVVKYGRTDDLLRRAKEHHKTFTDLDCTTRLKYHAWIDETMTPEAETEIKKHFNKMKASIKFGDMTELAVLTQTELKEVKGNYDMLYRYYGMKLKNKETQYKDNNDKLRNKLMLSKLKHET